MKITPSNKTRAIRLRQVPKHCPYCHHGIAPIEKYSCAYTSKARSRAWVDVTFQCPLCSHLFVATFERNSTALVLRGEIPDYTSTGIATPVPFFEQLPATIAAVSAGFVQIYEQAQTAEQAGLDQIAGLGYRKALEFLVKDYLISLEPTEAGSIKRCRWARA